MPHGGRSYGQSAEETECMRCIETTNLISGVLVISMVSLVFIQATVSWLV
jgi:hypothetical protein